jgi:apolipoprotein N-acyltransferase
VGRVYDRLPAHVEGTLTATLPLDARYTVYTRLGDIFAMGCTLVTALVAVWGWVTARRWREALAAPAA